MYKIISSFIFFIIFFCGCDSTEPIVEEKSDIATINQNLVGFSFAHGISISIPNSENIVPDILILAHTDEHGNVLGVFFGADIIRPAFNLVKEFSEVDSAKTFFENLSEVPDSNYQDLALPIRVNQIWAVKTIDDKYGKILILNETAYYDSAANNYFTEAKFRWKYQPNGSKLF
ncbi:MAG: hypothetical protein KDC52_09300 [Ignavibacteriae bacterium]|nr:hypothetical protein [Ignavibacteriota bacterium]MCB0751657.1 hypothetical protein [Ignavibacteriota bacterium]